MVSPFLWIEESIGRFAGYPPFVGCHPDDTHILLADLSGRRLADGAILVMGQLRYGTQFCSLEKESVKIGDFDPRHLLVLTATWPSATEPTIVISSLSLSQFAFPCRTTAGVGI